MKPSFTCLYFVHKITIKTGTSMRNEGWNIEMQFWWKKWERQGSRDALWLYVGEGVNGPVSLRPSYSPPPLQPQLIVFFLPWNHLSSLSLRLYIFACSRCIYTHVSICMSSHIWRIVSIKREEGNTEEWIRRERIKRSGGCGGLGAQCLSLHGGWGPMCTYVCVRVPSSCWLGHPVGDTEVHV